MAEQSCNLVHGLRGRLGRCSADESHVRTAIMLLLLLLLLLLRLRRRRRAAAAAAALPSLLLLPMFGWCFSCSWCSWLFRSF